MLQVESLYAGYSGSQVLHDISFSVAKGEAVALLGRNGMGKTTTIRSIFGLLRPTAGRVLINGVDLTGAAPHRIARAGLGLVPEGRQIFPMLSSYENLMAVARPGSWTLDRVLALFPRLAQRLDHAGGKLSGGEQQMLAIARALMTNPALLVLDEATEGLAPLIRDEIWSCLETLRAGGEAIIVVDRNIAELSRFVDRHLVMENGRIVWQGNSAALMQDAEIIRRHLSV